MVPRILTCELAVGWFLQAGTIVVRFVPQGQSVLGVER